MVFSILGYFLSMIMVLTAAVGVMIGLFNFSTSERVGHTPHPRPAIERNVTVPNGEPRLFMSVPETKDGSPAKNVEGSSAAAPDEKADAKKSKPHKRKVFARQRNNNYGYGNVWGYADAYRNGSQRPFSNW
ncbi:MAG: hypothetical protein WCD69_22750 [Xanthobacteraceae bacterium]